MVDKNTIVTLARYRGNLTHARASLAAAPSVTTFDITTLRKNEGLAYVHHEPSEPIEILINTLESHEIILDMPIKFRPNGTILIRLIAPGETLQQALMDLPEMIDVELEETGRFYPTGDKFESLLTDRQAEILQIAVEKGYYSVPRRTTISELTDEFDISQATLGEHLQKIEANILSHTVQ